MAMTRVLVLKTGSILSLSLTGGSRGLCKSKVGGLGPGRRGRVRRPPLLLYRRKEWGSFPAVHLVRVDLHVGPTQSVLSHLGEKVKEGVC